MIIAMRPSAMSRRARGKRQQQCVKAIAGAPTPARSVAHRDGVNPAASKFGRRELNCAEVVGRIHPNVSRGAEIDDRNSRRISGLV